MRIMNEQGKSRSFGLIVLVAVITLLVSSLSVFAAGSVVTKWSTAKDQQNAVAYMTANKMAQAKPFPMPVDTGQSGVDADALAEEDFTGLGVTSPAGKASSYTGEISEMDSGEDGMTSEDLEALEEVSAADMELGTKGVYTYYDVNNQTALWNIYPHKWSGRLYFTTPSGTSYCSATVIKNNSIVTAAHCVYDTGSRNQFYTNWVFVPAYRNGSAPFGSFTWKNARVLTNYINLSGSYSINGWARYDVAIIQLNSNSTGTVNNRVGYAGYAYDQSYTQLVFNNGYPWQNYNAVAITSPGAYLRSCTAESFNQTVDTLGSGCYWGPGISGGGWLLNYKPFVVSGYVNSVNSGYYIGQQNLYGARFSSNNYKLLCQAGGCL